MFGDVTSGGGITSQIRLTGNCSNPSSHRLGLKLQGSIGSSNLAATSLHTREYMLKSLCEKVEGKTYDKACAVNVFSNDMLLFFNGLLVKEWRQSGEMIWKGSIVSQEWCSKQSNKNYKNWSCSDYFLQEKMYKCKDKPTIHSCVKL